MTMVFKVASPLGILVASQANLAKPMLGDLNAGDIGLGGSIFGESLLTRDSQSLHINGDHLSI